MAKLNLSSPWVCFYRQVNAMFEKDPEVHVLFDEENYILKIFVDDSVKAEAITRLMPEERVFGNVSLKIEIIPANTVINQAIRWENVRGFEFSGTRQLFEQAFSKNPAFIFSEEVYLSTNTLCYVVFNREVVQYFSDDLGSYYGVTSTLYENLARDIFKDLDGVYYCTNDRLSELSLDFWKIPK